MNGWNSVVVGLNACGEAFWSYAAAMFVQSGIFILVLLGLDHVIRKRVRAVVRYAMWMLVLVKLVLPSSLTSPVSIGAWLGHMKAPDIKLSLSRPVAHSSVPSERRSSETVEMSPLWSTDEPGIATVAHPQTPLAPRQPHIQKLNWKGSLLLSRCLGFLVFGFLIVHRYIAVLALVRRSSEADGKFETLLRECCNTLEMRRGRVRLKTLPNPGNPAVCGIFRPVILLPMHLFEDLKSDRMRAVFLHELAHIRRRDLEVNLWQTLLQVVYFYHPLVWLANARIRRIREQAVDETVVVTLGEDAPGYSEALVQIFETAFRRAPVSLHVIGVVESKRALAQRILHLARMPIHKTATVGILGLGFVLSLALLLLPMARADPQSAPVGKIQPADSYEYSVLVRDKLENPLQGVEVTAEWVRTPHWSYRDLGVGQVEWPLSPVHSIPIKGRVTGVSDGEGIARLSWRDSDANLGVFLSFRKDGYNPISRSPVVGLVAAGVGGTTDGPTLFPLADCVKLVGTVIDAESMTPVIGAQIIEMMVWHYWRRREIWDILADGSFHLSLNVRNHTQLDRPDPAIQAAGYPIQRGDWVDQEGNAIDFKNPDLAGETLVGVTVRIHKGVVLPGELVKADGTPVADATLKWEPVRWHYVVHTTDAEGRFTFGPVLQPEQQRKQNTPYADITWPGFVRPYQATLNPEEGYPEEWVIRLPKERMVRGRLIDESSLPVECAQIAAGSLHTNWIDPPKQELPGGIFEIPAPVDKWEKHAVVAVQSPGFAPQVVTWTDAETDDPDTSITLFKGADVGGKVVDEVGNPIQKVWIVSEDIGGSRGIRKGTSSGMDGTFQIASLPTNLTVNFSIIKEGYMSLRDVVMTPGRTDLHYVMTSTLEINGQVLDGDTGEPVSSFIVVPGGRHENSESEYWNDHKTTKGTNGAFQISFGEPDRGRPRLLRIEAEGYFPMISDVLPEHSVNDLEFLLEPGEGIVATVVRADGAPAAGAETYLATPMEWADIQNGHFSRRYRGPRLKETDERGVVSFPPQTNSWHLIALHDDGFAEIGGGDRPEPLILILQPWGRIEGEIRSGRSAVPDADIWLNFPGVSFPGERRGPGVRFHYSTKSDADGRFSFDRVPPKGCKVSFMRYTPGEDARSSSIWAARSVSVRVQPGVTEDVVLGGTGRPVSGRVALSPEFIETVDWSTARGEIRLMDSADPPGLEDVPGAEKLKWLDAWQKTDEARQWSLERSNRRILYRFTLDEDGGFLANDIPAGAYEMRVELQIAGSADEASRRSAKGSIARAIEVPEMAGSRSDVPLDLGTIGLPMFRELVKGDPAPPFELLDGSGKPVRLQDYRGRYLLLAFWNCTRGSVQHAYLETLPSICQEYGYGQRLEIIGLNLDKYKDMAAAFVEEHGLIWPQVYLGYPRETDISQAYGVGHVPEFFLIDPMGKIVEGNIPEKELPAMIAESL